jgi:branched-chain amino acid transport system permease protein
MSVWRRPGNWAIWVIAVGAVALPFWVKVPYFMHLIILALIWVVMAQGQNLMQGFTGYVSIAQAGFMGVGAYFSTLLTTRLGWSVWGTMAMAPLFTAFIAMWVGYPSLRVKGHYFAIVTLACNMVIFTILLSYSSLTGGEAGIAHVPRPATLTWGDWALNFEGRSNINYYHLVLVMAALSVGVSALVLYSRVGRVLLSIRQNETLAEAIGVVTWRYKLFAFMLSASMAGLAGALYAHYMGFLNPEPFGVDQSLNAILAVILGGSGTLSGPVVGSFAVVFLPEYLRIADSYRLITYGLILVVATIFLPHGLVPMICRTLSACMKKSGVKK